MVCIPCFIIPVLLYVWHRFLQPIVLPVLLKFWNPWEKKDADGKIIQAGPEFPFTCKGGVCPYVPSKQKLENGEENKTTSATSINSSNQEVNPIVNENSKKDN